MKKTLPIIIIVLVFFLGGIYLFFKSLIIEDPQPNQCVVETVTIKKIYEASSYDIVFVDTGNDKYYINGGLERGLNLDSLNSKVLNKTVTLHLPNLWLGVSEHISQLTVDDEIIFTEFD